MVGTCLFIYDFAMQSFVLFCQFHLELVAKKLIMTDETRWQKYQVAIQQLSVDLCGGFTRRVADEKGKRDRAKAKLDRQLLEGFPEIPALKLAVHKAMLVLQHIKEKATGRSALHRRELGEATVALIGILALNGYFGRKKEWQKVTMAHVLEQLSLGLDYIVCDDHKTAKVYGDLAKWLAPGTIAAIRCYLGLPRRAGVETLLCPVGEYTSEVDIPSALRLFCARFFPTGCTPCKVNLLRKWYHTKLHGLATRGDTLLEILRVVDGHSASVANKHYILHGPADDAKLAKHLVHALIGQTVPWPTSLALEDRTDDAVIQLVARMDGEDDASSAQDTSQKEDADDHEGDLEWFANAHLFGIDNPNLAVLDEEVSTPSAQQPQRTPSADSSTQGGRTIGSEGGSLSSKRKAETLLHHPQIAKLPRLFLGLATKRTELSAAEVDFDNDARKVCKNIALPMKQRGQYKARYFMEPEEKLWVSRIHECYRQVTSRNGSTAFFNRLYQWGVHTEALNPKCSPAGMQSLAKRGGHTEGIGHGCEQEASSSIEVVPAKRAWGMDGQEGGSSEAEDLSTEAAMLRIHAASTAAEMEGIVKEQSESHSETSAPKSTS